MKKIGIIGGSGLENPDILKNPKIKSVNTPYGKPSSDLLIGKINDVDVVILSRHGKNHEITPTKVNNRANIYALKEEGCTHIIATTACGSLRDEIKRGDIVVLDQFIDFTRHREITFFDKFDAGEIKHTPMSDPFDEYLRETILKTSAKIDIPVHKYGTVITIEGPRFSTRAESHMFRNWGAQLINMSTAPEAILANEIGIPYVALAMSTDYDCWKSEEDAVSWEDILKVFNKNIEKVINLITNTLPSI